MKKLIGLLIVLLFTRLCVYAQSGFDKKITQAAKQLYCATPTEQTPVTINARTLTENDSIAVIVKVNIAPGWHIYQYVPPTLPYIPLEHILKPSEGIQAVGTWQITKPFSSVTDAGVLVYENNALFVHKLVRSAGEKTKGVIHTGLYYQTCNLQQCLPPDEKTFDLKTEPED